MSLVRTATTLSELAENGSAGFTPVPRSGEDLAAILYTSGTTGRSKGAMLSHRALASNARVLKVYWQFTRDDVLIHALPVFHTHGLFVATNVALLAGASLEFLPKFDAKQILEAMPRATTLMGVPTFYTRLLKESGLERASEICVCLYRVPRRCWRKPIKLGKHAQGMLFWNATA